MSEIMRGMELIHPDSKLIELRPLMPDGRWWQGIFDDRDKLVKVIESLNEIEAEAVYWSVNSISPDLADRATNLIAPAKRGGCIGNKHIDRIKWLFLDLDTKEDWRTTLEFAKKIKNYLDDEGWGEPYFFTSGLGYYLFYPVDLPPDQAPLIKKVVNSLADRFDTPEAIVDRKCANPGRIARVPGTYNRKDGNFLCCWQEDIDD